MKKLKLIQEVKTLKTKEKRDSEFRNLLFYIFLNLYYNDFRYKLEKIKWQYNELKKSFTDT